MKNLLLITTLLTSSFWVSILSAAEITINTISVKALDDFSLDPSSNVLASCSLRSGVTAEAGELQDAISRDVDALLDSGYYSYVRADLEPVGDTVNIIYVISRRMTLEADPIFIGLDHVFGESKLIDEIGLADGSPVDEALTEVAITKIKSEYIKKDYPHVTVDAMLESNKEDPSYATLTFTINTGEQVSVDDYTFSGNHVMKDATLARSFGWLPVWDPRGWFRDFPTSEQELDDARIQMRDLYLSSGYLDAEIREASYQPISSDEVNAHFDVDEGQQYLIGEVYVKGMETFSSKSVIEQIKKYLEIDNVATTERITALRDMVEFYYGSRGYVDTYVKQQTIGRETDDPIVDLTFTVTEGERVTIRDVIITGNSRTNDKVIRRELAVIPGQQYDEAYVITSENRLRNLNYFEEPNGVSSYTIKTDEPGVRDLVFNVRDTGDTGKVGFGLGVSSIDSVFGFATASESNFDLFAPSKGFKGGGQRASIGVEVGSRRKTVEASWTEPWFRDKKLSLTVDAYSKTRWYDHYDENRTGGAVTLSWNAQFRGIDLNRVGVKYTLESVSYEDMESGQFFYKNGSPYSYEDEEDGINSKLRLFWAKNTRNHAFIPTKGVDTIAYVDGGLGGASKTVGIGFSYRRWFNLVKDHVLLTKFRIDTIGAYSGDVPMFDRYFLGGGRSVRGFEYRDMGRKVYREENGTGDHVAIGGQTAYCATLEYTIPLVSALRFATFFDFGAVGDDSFDLGSDVGASVGIGFRIDIPNFPIRFDLAKPIVNDDDTEEETFLFHIGIE